MARAFLYCRCSTSEQQTSNQVREAEAAGFSIEPYRVIEEIVSGSVAAMSRPGFSSLMNKLERGDILIVTKIDRLGRNAHDVRSVVEHLAEVGIRVHCLQLGGMDLGSPAGKMTMAVISAVGEMELDLLRERTRSGLERVKAEGKTLGRRRTLKAADEKAVLAKRLAGASLGKLAEEYGVSRSAIQRIERRAEKPV